MDSRKYMREYMRQWRVLHRDRWLEIQRKANHKHDATLREALFKKYGRVCAWCGSRRKLHLDHVYNDALLHMKSKGHISRNGRPSAKVEWREALLDTAGRFQMLCAKCNETKRLQKAENHEN